jgi:thiamine biosynthesis lipoprotein
VVRGHVVRPVGLRLDSGGLGKGLAADLMAEALSGCASWVVDCGGDVRLGGTSGVRRAVLVGDPFDRGTTVHELELSAGAVATSGTTRRRWDHGHHLIDPRTGAPADSGIVQATAIAATGLEAEVRAKAALLSGLDGAPRYLPHGGVLVTDDAAVHLVEAEARCA